MGARQRERLQWGVVGVICVLLFLAFRPYYYYIVETRDFQTCQSNMLQIAGALGRYKSDWDDTLPQGATWTDTITPYLSPRSGTGFKAEDILRCPTDKTGAASSYAWNTLFDGYSESQRSLSALAEENRKKLGRADRVPMVLEVHGSARNAVVRPKDWDGVAQILARPHNISGGRSGSVINGGLKPSHLSTERLAIKRGDDFTSR
jgi:hypothetical protein